MEALTNHSGVVPKPCPSRPEKFREEHGAWNREHGTGIVSGEARIHRHLGEGPSPAPMDGRFADSIGGGRR